MFSSDHASPFEFVSLRTAKFLEATSSENSRVLDKDTAEMPSQIRLTPPPTLLMAPRAISYARSILPALEQFGVLDDMIAVGHTVGDRCWRIFRTGETIVYNHDAVRDITNRPYSLTLGLPAKACGWYSIPAKRIVSATTWRCSVPVRRTPRPCENSCSLLRRPRALRCSRAERWLKRSQLLD